MPGGPQASVSKTGLRHQAKPSSARPTPIFIRRGGPWQWSLKEELRLAIRTKGDEGIALLAHWLNWASHCRIRPFVELGRKIRRHRVPIEAALRSGSSNALVESTNTKIRVLTRTAFGFRSPEALIAMAMLAVGGVCPELPGRDTPVPLELSAA